MGFAAPNLQQAERDVRRCIVEISSPYNDGWTQMSCKHQLYQLKCLIDEEYSKLPVFVGEEIWEQERIFNILKA
jgi:hypothetical protein